MSKQDRAGWVAANVITTDLEDEILAYVDQVVSGGQKLSQAINVKLRQVQRTTEGGDNVTPADVLAAVLPIVAARWGEDELTKPMARIIALGDFVF